MTDTVITLTNSEVQDFEDCARKWWLTVYRELGKPEGVEFNRPTSIGTMYHAGLAAYYTKGVHPAEYAKKLYAAAVVKLAEEYDELTRAPYMSALEKEQDLVVTMLEGYYEWLEETAADEFLEVLGAEELVVVPLAKGLVAQGKIDAPARWKYSPEILSQLEHKTVGNFEDIPKTAQVNPQFLQYDLLAYLRAKILGTGERTDGVIVNMGRKVKRSARANPPFFARHEVRHNEAELRAHWKHLVSAGREIQRARARLDAGEDHHVVVPPHVTRDCAWKCPFAGPCLSGMFDNGEDVEGYLARNYVHRDPLARYTDKPWEDEVKEEA